MLHCARVDYAVPRRGNRLSESGIAWEIVEKFYGVTKDVHGTDRIANVHAIGESYPAAHDLTSLRVIACAGEPLNPEAWRWAQTHLAAMQVGTSWRVGGRPTGRARARHSAVNGDASGKSGRSRTRAEADVLDENGKSAPAGVGGRLVLKRPFPHMLRTVWRSGTHERDWQRFRAAM